MKIPENRFNNLQKVVFCPGEVEISVTTGSDNFINIGLIRFFKTDGQGYSTNAHPHEIFTIALNREEAQDLAQMLNTALAEAKSDA